MTHAIEAVGAKRSRLTPGTLVAAAFAVALAQVALAVPAVFNGLFQEDLQTSSSQLTWITDAFLVPVTLLELTSGVIGDLFGRKRLLVGGALLLTLGQVISILVPGASSSSDARVAVLWIGQVLAGAGAAALFPTTLAMVAAGTHTPADRARSLTIWAAALSVGGAISPVLGGLVAKLSWGSDPYASWRWGFLVVAVLGLVSAGVSLLFAEESKAPEGRSLDWGGQITIGISLLALLYAVIQGPADGWGSGRIVAAFVIAAAFLALFVVVELRSPAPLLRLSLFSNRSFTVASIATVVGMLGWMGTAYSTSIRLSAIQGFSPLKSSIGFLLINGIALVQMPVTHRVMERFNPRWVMGGGLLLIAVGDVWMSQVDVAHISIAPVVAPLALVGIGFAFAVSSVSAVAVNSVPNHLAGMASGTTSLLRDLGITLGPAVIGAIALGRATSDIHNRVASDAALQSAMTQFDSSAPPAVAGAVNSGPLGAVAIPQAVNPLHDTALAALGHAFSVGLVVCAVLALASALLTVFGLRGTGAHDTLIETESLVDPVQMDPA